MISVYFFLHVVIQLNWITWRYLNVIFLTYCDLCSACMHIVHCTQFMHNASAAARCASKCYQDLYKFYINKLRSTKLICIAVDLLLGCQAFWPSWILRVFLISLVCTFGKRALRLLSWIETKISGVLTPSPVYKILDHFKKSYPRVLWALKIIIKII